MPVKINMLLSNGNILPVNLKQININSLASNTSISSTAPKGVISLKGNMLARVHNIQPGCGSCGRH
jgi:hypothetical protein